LPKDKVKLGKAQKAGLFVRCECDFEILLVPNVKVMERAIEVHAAEYGKREKDPVRATVEEERIQDLLIVRIFNAAAS
jgi:hypothetical protein